MKWVYSDYKAPGHRSATRNKERPSSRFQSGHQPLDIFLASTFSGFVLASKETSKTFGFTARMWNAIRHALGSHEAGVEGPSRSSDRPSRWEIGLKIEIQKS